MGGRAGSFFLGAAARAMATDADTKGRTDRTAESKWPVGQGPECEFEDNSQHIMDRHLLTENPSDKFDTNAAR